VTGARARVGGEVPELASSPSNTATEVMDRAADVRARRVPGVEARVGKSPGPSLIPALNAI
jgi:hypothetical protein